MKKIIFKGIGPSGNVIHDGKMIEDGAIIDIEKDIADAYIRTGLAYEVEDENIAKRMQEQAIKNKVKREEVVAAASVKKKGGKK